MLMIEIWVICFEIFKRNEDIQQKDLKNETINEEHSNGQNE